MTITICERGRRILPWILERANSGDEFAAFDVTSQSLLHTELWNSVNDPAKLAAMIADEGRRHGLDAGTFLYGVDRAEGGEDVRIWHGYVNGKTQVSVGRSVRSSCSRMLTQAEMRAILAKLLQLPDDSRDEAERILRGDTFEVPPEIPLREYPEPRRFDPDPDRERDNGQA